MSINAHSVDGRLMASEDKPMASQDNSETVKLTDAQLRVSGVGELRSEHGRGHQLI